MSMMTRDVVNHYFDDLEAVVARLGLQDKPQQIWNRNETGLQFCPDASKVIAQKGTRSLVARSSPCKDSVTTMACISASGASMPPMCVVKGKTNKAVQSFAVQDAPKNTFWTFQKSGWMDDELGVEWFRKVFLRNCGTARPQLLVLDSHHSHEVLELLELARQEDVHLFALPPHTTHMLQPLDRVVFKSLKSAYKRSCTEFLSANHGLLINKVTWPGLLNKAWTETMRTQLPQKAFEATGIHPINRNRIPDSAFMPSDCRAAAPSSSLSTVTVEGETTSDDMPAELEVDISFLNGLVIDIEGEEMTIETLNESMPSGNWNVEIEEAFASTPAPNKKPSTSQSKRIHSHRVLTSDAIIEIKQNEKERKDKEAAAKQERQEKRAKRKLEMVEGGKNKKQKS